MKNKAILNSYAIAFTAINLLRMKKNGLVERTVASLDKDLDLPENDIGELAKAIKQLENIVIFILKRIRLSKEETAYTKKKILK